MVRCGIVLVGAALCVVAQASEPVAGAVQTDTDSLPKWLDAYAVNGSVSFYDLRWATAKFDRTEEGAERWNGLELWINARKQAETNSMREKFKALGVKAERLQLGCYEDDTCTLIDTLDAYVDHFSQKLPDAATLLSAAREASPAVEGFRLAMQTTWHVAGADPSSMTSRLNAALLCDQAYMIAITGLNYKDRTLPVLSDAGRLMFYFGLSIEMHKQERLHQEYVDSEVVRERWPERKAVGAEGEYALWLIVQHADENPVFQYRMLRVMEPLIVSGDLSADKSAYLYDRVMLKVVGEQRYGTQLTCEDGRLVPQPLELNGRNVEDSRRKAHMPSLAQYVEQFPKTC